MPEFDPHRLRALRRARGLNADQLAVATGRTASAVYKYERGEIVPSLATLCRISEVLGVSVEKFIDPDATEPSPLADLLAAQGVGGDQR